MGFGAGVEEHLKEEKNKSKFSENYADNHHLENLHWVKFHITDIKINV